MAEISYYEGDERPAWQPSITVGGVSEDYSTGYSFTVEVADHNGTVHFTKTTGITGASGGVVTVDWATTGELSTLSTGKYLARLRVRRDSDSKDITAETTLRIRPGLSA